MDTEDNLSHFEELKTRRLERRPHHVPLGIRVIQGLLLLDILFIVFNAFIRFQESGIVMIIQILFAALLGLAVWGMQHQARWSYYLTGLMLLGVIIFSAVTADDMPWVTVLMSLFLVGLLVRNREYFSERKLG